MGYIEMEDFYYRGIKVYVMGKVLEARVRIFI
jgi:hypothetical protein